MNSQSVAVERQEAGFTQPHKQYLAKLRAQIGTVTQSVDLPGPLHVLLRADLDVALRPLRLEPGARAVDEDVDGPQVVADGREHLADLVRVGHVAGVRLGRVQLAGELGGVRRRPGEQSQRISLLE